jgi:hypothetical protein
MKKLLVTAPAIKYGTKIVKGTKKMSHDDIVKKEGKDGTRGFMLSNGKFAGRAEAARVAKTAGEVSHPGKTLHSHELRAGKRDK